MKTKLSIFIMIAILILAISPITAFAQTGVNPPESTNTTEVTTLQGEDVYTLRDLGYADQVMNGPYDYLRIRFNLPETWLLKDATNVQLKIRNIVSSANPISESELVAATGATLDINFNSKWVKTLTLDWTGEQLVTIPIPADMLINPTGQYNLSLYLDAGIDCLYDHQTTVVISADSVIELKHDMVEPKIDLTQFPSPIYQANSLVQSGALVATVGGSSVLLVMPDKPSQGELQAALTLSAGLSYLSRGNLVVDIVPVSGLTDDIKRTNNLVFVGKGADFGVLAEAALPAAYDGKKFAVNEAQPEDGVIQGAISPWNPANVVMVFSSDTDEGLIKAAQAASTGIIRVGNRPDLAIVSDITVDDGANSVPVDRTLADLGYASVQMGGVRYNPVDYLDVQFYVPAGQTVDGEAYINVYYSNSSTLDMEQSGLSVLLNGNTIGGVAFTQESAKTVSSQIIPIPGFLLRPGTNLITIEANNHPMTYCSDLMYANAWTTLYDQTLIHLPLKPAEEKTANYATLANFADLLTASPNLDRVAFVVAPNSSQAVSAASKVATTMGEAMIGDMVELKAVYADQVPEDYRQGYDLVLVGKASEIPMLAELGDQLPAPFETGKNVALESVLRVIYRLPEDVSLGYLELVKAPLDSERNILAILGSTDEGVIDAANAFTIDVLKNKLAGNYAVVRGEQVVTSDTRFGAGSNNLSATVVPEVTQEVVVTTETPVPGSPIPVANQTGWILPVIGIVSVLIVALIIGVALRGRQK